MSQKATLYRPCFGKLAMAAKDPAVRLIVIHGDTGFGKTTALGYLRSLILDQQRSARSYLVEPAAREPSGNCEDDRIAVALRSVSGRPATSVWTLLDDADQIILKSSPRLLALTAVARVALTLSSREAIRLASQLTPIQSVMLPLKRPSAVELLATGW